MVLTICTLLPLLALVTVGAFIAVQREQAIVKRGMVDRTRALMTAIDAKLRGSVSTLTLLSESQNLDLADLTQFYDEVTRTLPAQPDWISVHLSDATDRRVMDSDHVFDGLSMPLWDPGSAASVRRTRQPVISNLFRASGTYLAAVRVPVIRDDEVKYVLAAIIDPQSILELLRLQRIPQDWVAVVLDGNRRIVARTMDSDRMFSNLASESLRLALDQQHDGWFQGNTLEGTEVYTPYVTSEFSGWAVAFGVPSEFVESGIRDAQKFVGLGLAIALTFALLLAWNMSRRISRPIAALASAAKALERGKSVNLPHTGTVSEVYEVGRALNDAAKAVQEREQRLREADQAKDDFLAMLGHELRNPLSALSSASQVLQFAHRGKGDESWSQVVPIIDRQVRHMARMVDDLLDTARVTTGKVLLDRRPLDLADAVTNAVQDMRAAEVLKDHDLHLDTWPVWVEADEPRIDQIVSNVVSNAVKYTPGQGRIDIRVFRRGDNAIVEVADNGVGLAAEDVPRVFDLFWQGEQALDRAGSGLGVGLTLVRNLVQLHGGEVNAHSEGRGRGTCFTISIPAIEEPVESIRNQDRKRDPLGHGESVLLIEDNSDARQMLCEALTLHGFKVLEAADGYTGLEMAKQSAPQAAVIDIGLPGIDGLEVARRLRAEPKGARMALIAISGYGQGQGQSGLQNATDEVGFDALITKPVLPDALAQTIASTLARKIAGLRQVGITRPL
jgi:signal transduction histidine kinase